MFESFLRMPDVEKRVGLKRSAIYLMISRGEFPAPVKLSARVSVWPESEIQEWITKKLTERAA